MSTLAIAEIPHHFGSLTERALDHQMDEVPLNQKRDDVLITLFQAGEENAFRVLVERYQDRVRSLIYSVLREDDIIDDISQDVFIKVYQGLSHFRFESSFYTWLYRITINKTRDELRKRKVRRFFSLESSENKIAKEIAERFKVEPHDTEPAEMVAKGLQALPEKFRMPLVLKDIEGMSYEEIANVLDCRIGTVKSRLSRGRAMLRDILKPLLEENRG